MLFTVSASSFSNILNVFSTTFILVFRNADQTDQTV